MINLAKRHTDFDGLTIAFDDRVLHPRAWTVEQSRWAAALLADLPAGPVLELCCGAAHIGLAAVQHSDRRLVCVDASPAAIEVARGNTRRAAMDDRVDLRLGTISTSLRREETFALVIADPPWVTTDQVSMFPADPRSAIDGGTDGLAVARHCLTAIEQHLHDDGAALLQLGTVDQVALLMSLGRGAVRCLETRQYSGGVVARIGRVEPRADTMHPSG